MAPVPTVVKHTNVLTAVLKDLASLRRPVTAAAVAATLAAVVSPFGLNVGPDGTLLVGILGVVGLAAAYIQHLKGA